MFVGVVPLHYKDLNDLNTWTVLMHLISDESLDVRDAPAPSAKSASTDKTSEERGSEGQKTTQSAKTGDGVPSL